MSAQILRHRSEGQFVSLPNKSVRDPRLSFKATGLLAYLISLPDGASILVADLVEKKPDGAFAVKAAMKELVAAGYMDRRRVRNPDGTFHTEITVGAVPLQQGTLDDSPQAETVDGTTRGFPTSDNRPSRSEEPSTEVVPSQEEEPFAPAAPTPTPKATDDPITRTAHRLTVLAFEQTPKPVSRGGFPAVLKIFEQLLRAGTVVVRLEKAIRAGIDVWTVAGVQTAMAKMGTAAAHGPRSTSDEPRQAEHSMKVLTDEELWEEAR